MLKKAATSCLSAQDVKTLQFEPYAEGHELEIYPASLAGFKIPYFTLDGKVDPDTFRFRLLQSKPSKGWAAITEEAEKPRRYTQKQGTNCGVYLPPLLAEGLSWKEVARTPEMEVIITEGELKAACGCKMGFPTIGLGGVYNWRSAKEGFELLPILEKIDWRGRKVYIVFDSDTKTNPMVRMAASRLAWILGVRGAVVHLVNLPENGEGGKQGLDDFIYARRAVHAKNGDLYTEGINAFGELVVNSQDIGPGKELHRLNSEVGLVRKTNEIVEIFTGNVYTPAAFSDSLYKNRTYIDNTEDNQRMNRKFAAKEWLAIEHRTEFSEFVYDPSCNHVVTPAGAYNTWYPQRWPLQPSKTVTDPATGLRRTVSMKLWEQLFDHVFSSLTDEHKQWVKCWLAYPIQHPGAKLFTAMLVWGRTTGTGKSRIGESMKAIYGKNFTLIKNAHLTANFNEWAENKQFIVGDEIAIGDKRGVADTLKGMITGDIVRLNIKNRKSYDVVDCINYYFSSNHEDAVYLENHDRRFFIVKADVPRMPSTFYQDYMRWLEHEGGAARLFHYLKYEVNTEAHVFTSSNGRKVEVPAFDPKGEAPVTDAKLEMMASSRSDAEDWAFQLVQNPDKILPTDKPWDLFTAKELLKVYDPMEREKIRANGISRALNAAGAFKVANGSNHVRVAGARDSVYAIRNVDRYRRLGPKEIGALYDAERPIKFDRGVGDSKKFAANGKPN